MLVPCTENREVIKEDLHKSRYVFIEDFRDDAVKCCMRRFKPEHDYHGYEYAPIHQESGFFLIFRMHTDLIIAAEAI